MKLSHIVVADKTKNMKIGTFLSFMMINLMGCHEKNNASLITSNLGCAPITTDREWYAFDNKAPLFEDLGSLHYPIVTQNKLLQKYFNQGLILAYGFNHAEAARSFYYATKLDPDCAMAYWGYAYVLGPNYNAGMENDNYERAFEAIQKALELSRENDTEKERKLIGATAKRYVKEPLEDRSQLDIDYSNALAILTKQYPNDADIGTLYAESLMNLHKWDLYTKEGEPKEWTPKIISTLERIIDEYPEHPGAHHFYIHAVESSNTPEKGLKSARLFDDGLVPNAGHLVHMSSHIYIRTGDYRKGTLANINAIKVDSGYVAACNAQGVYPLSYFPHNQHFMAATATLEGNSKLALYAADAVASNANKQLMKEPGWGTIQHYYTIPFYVYVKFGKWDKILQMENEVTELDYPQAIYHYARGMAYMGKDKIDSAKAELKSLRRIAANQKLKEITIWDINSVYDLVQIAEKVLSAEVSLRDENHLRSLTPLKEAIDIEDSLNYNEPPDWFFSVRHYLGAAQLEHGLYKDAVKTYKEDLQKLPKNGWALKGLTLAYSKLKDSSKLTASNERFREAWATADVELNASVLK